MWAFILGTHGEKWQNFQLLSQSKWIATYPACVQSSASTTAPWRITEKNSMITSPTDYYFIPVSITSRQLTQLTAHFRPPNEWVVLCSSYKHQGYEVSPWKASNLIRIKNCAEKWDTWLLSLEYSTNVLLADFTHLCKQIKGLEEAKRATLKYITATYSSDQLLLSLMIYWLGWQ